MTNYIGQTISGQNISRQTKAKLFNKIPSSQNSLAQINAGNGPWYTM